MGAVVFLEKVLVIIRQICQVYDVSARKVYSNGAVEPLRQCTRVNRSSGCGMAEDKQSQSKQSYESASHEGFPLLFLEEQLAGSVRGLYHCFDQRDAQLPFLEFEDAVDGAARWRGNGVFQQRWMVAGFENNAGCAFHCLRRE